MRRLACWVNSCPVPLKDFLLIMMAAVFNWAAMEQLEADALRVALATGGLSWVAIYRPRREGDRE